MNSNSVGLEGGPPSGRTRGVLTRLKISLVVVCLFGLVIFNVLTLVNDDVHAVGYNIVWAAVASAVTDAVAARALSGSPTATKHRAVGVATRDLLAKNVELERSHIAIESKRNELEASHKALATTNAALTKEFKDLTDKHVDLQTTHKELSDRHADLQTTHKETESRHAHLKQVSVRRTSLVSAISKRVGKRAAINAAKNVSSFALEVVPIAGVAAITALTISDLYDDCQTMKDVNELNVEFELQKEDVDKVCGLKIPTLH